MGCITNPVLMKSALMGCDIVMHFAGLKAVAESSVKPLEYYRINVGGTINLLKVRPKPKNTRVFTDTTSQRRQ